MGFKIGERVVVIKDEYSFRKNEHFFKDNKIDFKIATRYAYGTSPLNGDEGIVVAIGDLEHYDHKGIVIKDIYNKCYLVREPGLKSLEKEFKPHLECAEVGIDDYGTIGKETRLVDRYGRKLKVGDVVILYIGEKFVVSEAVIVHNNYGYCFPLGYSTFTDKEILIKIRDCDEIPDGEKVGIIKYVKEER